VTEGMNNQLNKSIY
jgi:hypothetical protein